MTNGKVKLYVGETKKRLAAEFFLVIQK